MKVKSCICLLPVLFLFSPPAHAYLDPSTGSMIITAIVGLFASIALAIKTYWYRLKAFFTGKGKGRDSAPETAAEDSTVGESTESSPQAHANQSPEEHT